MSIQDSSAVQDPLIITFDVGTQSARAVLVDTRGNVVDSVKKVYKQPYYSLEPNWAEMSPHFYWQVITEACRELKNRSTENWGRLIAVTCTCIRGSAVCFDDHDHTLRDVILWPDKRVAKGLPPMSAKANMLFAAAGLTRPINTLREHMYCNWLWLNEPELWKKTAKYGLLSTFFNVMFTGILKDSYANMCGILPYDTKNHRWYPKSDFHRELYMIDDSQLIELVPPGTVLGPIGAHAAAATGLPEGLPYIVTGSDKMCETLGLSCTKNDTAAISLGTLSSIQVPSKRFFSMQMILPPFPSLLGDYLNEVQTYRGFWMVSWFKEEFAQQEMEQAKLLGVSAEELLDAHLNEIPPGCDGLIMQPTLTPDAITPHARGVFIGLTDIHTRMHFFRAIIEGIGFTLYEGLKALEKAGRTQVKKIFIAGGGSSSSEICQIAADILGLPVVRIQTGEASSLGSSLLAFVTMKQFASVDEAIQAMVHEHDRFEPNPETHRFYDKLYSEVYSKMFKNLVKLYRNIDDIVLK